jgi:pyruvate-ferredoxin/flavodoxin oxidoreductase
MFLGVEQSRDRVKALIKAALAAGVGADLKAAMEDWLEEYECQRRHP